MQGMMKDKKAIRLKALSTGKPTIKIQIKEKSPMDMMGMGKEMAGPKPDKNAMEQMMVSSEEKAMIEMMRKKGGMAKEESDEGEQEMA